MISMSRRVEIRKNLPSGTIVLNRPEQHNPLSRDVIDALLQALEDFHAERRVRGVILTGSGQTFCSGSDLKELYQTAQEPDAAMRWQDDLEQLQTLFETILRYPKPIVVALNGSAWGLGAALVLATDLVVAHRDCQLVFPEPSLGLSNCVGASLLAFRLGPAVAMPYLLERKPLTAERLSATGLAHDLVPADFVWAKAQERVTAIAAGAATSVTMTKKFVNESIGEGMFTNLSLALAQLAAARTTEAALEGLAAFAEKRPPQFP
jgi:methylglutaconyl-CoA hydratase